MYHKSPILYNAIRCPDGTIIESTYRWDFNAHTQEDGRMYAVDGGTAYLRRIHADREYEELSLDMDSPHELVREKFLWKSVICKDGNLLPEPITRPLSELDNEHVKALVEFTRVGYPSHYPELFIREIKFRGLSYDE